MTGADYIEPFREQAGDTEVLRASYIVQNGEVNLARGQH